MRPSYPGSPQHRATPAAISSPRALAICRKAERVPAIMTSSVARVGCVVHIANHIARDAADRMCMHAYTERPVRLCAYDLAPALLQKQQIQRLLKQGLRGGVFFCRKHFHLTHDL